MNPIHQRVGAVGRANRARTLLALFSVLALASCIHFVSYYDAVTYQNVTGLKGEARILFSDCEANPSGVGPSELPRFDALMVRMAKAREYEAGKALNDETAAQFEILETTLGEAIQRLKQEGALSTGYCKAKWMILDKAFDIAITTEKEKIDP